MEICPKEICTGCTACMTVCPKNCISMTENEIGHFIPQINDNICIDCGACKKICPSLNDVEKNMPACAYAATAKDDTEYKTSTSGGAAAVFSNYFIENGGVVYGCTGKNGYDVCHIRVDKKEDLHKLKGSKYVESRLGDTFKQIKDDLKNEKQVLFIGTPCQTAGAISLFGKNENFYAVDLICHGVPPQKLLKEHLKNNIYETPDEIKFRVDNGFYTTAIKNNKVLMKKRNLFDLYYIGFLKGLFYRSSCYRCKYSCNERVSDITIGDFWGLLKTELNTKNGVSVILTNTAKGKGLLLKCKEKLNLEEHPVCEAISGNHNLNAPSTKHKNADKFLMLYQNKGFKLSAKRCLFVNRAKYCTLYILQKIKRGLIKK